MNFMPPRYGEPIPLLCLKCKRMFVGPNPKGFSIFDDMFKKKKMLSVLIAEVKR